MNSVISSLKKKIHNFSKVIVAFSGGLDSTVLLHRLILLRKISENLVIKTIHINHNINTFSEKWANICKYLCRSWKVHYMIVNMSHNMLFKKSITEASLRSARYNIIHKIQQADELLLTAHNQNDQCETFLLALKRGSGISGLSAISELYMNKKKLWICRPMIQESRQSILDWANKFKLRWINDSMNYDTKFERNFIRYKLINTASNRWPYFQKMVSRSAHLCKKQSELHYMLIQKKLSACVKLNGSINILPLLKINPELRVSILRQWVKNQIEDFEYNLSNKDVINVWKEIALSKKNSIPKIKFGRNIISKYMNHLYIYKHNYDSLPEKIKWNKTCNKINLPHNLGYLVKDKFGTMSIRHPSNSETITIRFKCNYDHVILSNNKQKSLKSLWKKYKVPPWDRCRRPLIFYNETLIAAMNMFITKDGCQIDNNSSLKLSWITGKI